MREARRTKVRHRTMEKTSVIDTYVIRGLEVCDLSGTTAVKLPMVYTREEMPVSMEDVPRQADVDRWSYLRGIHIPDIDSQVDLLIGTKSVRAMASGAQPRKWTIRREDSACMGDSWTSSKL